MRDVEDRYSPQSFWPMHPLDSESGSREPAFDLYFGAAGVVWALHYLEAVGAVRLRGSFRKDVDTLLELNGHWLELHGHGGPDRASYLLGETGILLLDYWCTQRRETAARLEELIAGNIEHPARELMWGAPGTMLAALFLCRFTHERRWSELYVASAGRLHSQLEWSPDNRCWYFVQDLYGHRSTYLDAVHGFVATAAVLIQGRDLLEASEWAAWEQCIVETIRATALRQDGLVNWPPLLDQPGGSKRPQKLLMQFCHGAPGFVICLADVPTRALDDELLAAGEAIWQAGPLRKGANLCHGTGGNGYAFLKLYARTRDERWLARARAFAMHGIAQVDADARRHGQMRYSLWTGDPGFAIYLRDCVRAAGSFPTLETFFA